MRAGSNAGRGDGEAQRGRERGERPEASQRQQGGRAGRRRSQQQLDKMSFVSAQFKA